jgi:hypothetical protein
MIAGILWMNVTYKTARQKGTKRWGCIKEFERWDARNDPRRDASLNAARINEDS